jgi:hypothetical protein
MHKLNIGEKGLKQMAEDEELLNENGGPLAMSPEVTKPVDEEIFYEWDLEEEAKEKSEKKE